MNFVGCDHLQSNDRCHVKNKLSSSFSNANEDEREKADDETKEIVLKVPYWMYFFHIAQVSSIFVLVNNEIITSKVSTALTVYHSM